MVKKIHYVSGITIALFVAVHLINHLVLFWGEQAHIAFMNHARAIYRNPFVETLLIIAVVVQIVSGIQLVRKKWRDEHDIFDRLQIYSGLFLSYFLLAHVSVVLLGRAVLKLDTNLYFGAGVLNNDPAYFYFILHYGLAILSFFVHIACVHKTKMVKFTSPRRAALQAWILIGLGAIVSIAVVFRMMDVTIPAAYQYLPFGRY